MRVVDRWYDGGVDRSSCSLCQVFIQASSTYKNYYHTHHHHHHHCHHHHHHHHTYHAATYHSLSLISTTIHSVASITSIAVWLTKKRDDDRLVTVLLCLSNTLPFSPHSSCLPVPTPPTTTTGLLTTDWWWTRLCEVDRTVTVMVRSTRKFESVEPQAYRKSWVELQVNDWIR